MIWKIEGRISLVFTYRSREVVFKEIYQLFLSITFLGYNTPLVSKSQIIMRRKYNFFI